MAKVLPFNDATVGGTDVTTAEFVNGSGRLRLAGTDIAVTTADGKIHNVRQSAIREASFETYDDKTSLATANGLSAAMVFPKTSGVTFNGLATAVYNKNTETTRVEIKGDPATA